MARRSVAVSSRSLCKLGTLAHNKSFTVRDFVDYTGSSRAQVDAMVRRGVLRRVDRGRLYPTPKGWNVIERACRMRTR